MSVTNLLLDQLRLLLRSLNHVLSLVPVELLVLTSSSFIIAVDLFFIQLTTNGGQEKLSLKKSVFVELMLYASHWCSAWVSHSIRRTLNVVCM